MMNSVQSVTAFSPVAPRGNTFVLETEDKSLYRMDLQRLTGGLSIESSVRRLGFTTPTIERRQEIGSSLSSAQASIFPTQTEFPEHIVNHERFILLRQWEGYVEKLTDGGFTAHVSNMKDAGEVLEVEFDVDEILESDRELIEEGAVFYWSIGYHDKPSGRNRVSDIKFRRLPVWAQPAIDEARRKGRALASKLSRNHQEAAAAG